MSKKQQTSISDSPVSLCMTRSYTRFANDIKKQEHSIAQGFKNIEKNIKNKESYIPLHQILRFLGFGLDGNQCGHFISHIREKYLNQPKYNFLACHDFMYTHGNHPYDTNIEFTMTGFKKLCLVYTDSPKYGQILEYFLGVENACQN